MSTHTASPWTSVGSPPRFVSLAPAALPFRAASMGSLGVRRDMSWIQTHSCHRLYAHSPLSPALTQPQAASMIILWWHSHCSLSLSSSSQGFFWKNLPTKQLSCLPWSVFWTFVAVPSAFTLNKPERALDLAVHHHHRSAGRAQAVPTNSSVGRGWEGRDQEFGELPAVRGALCVYRELEMESGKSSQCQGARQNPLGPLPP